MIDSEGYRANVGIVLCNRERRVLWARRVGQNAWQFPQGGIRPDESPEEAVYRELTEEVGLEQGDVRILGQTRRWLHYRLPKNLIRYRSKPLCIGQKQRWFLLELVSDDHRVRLDTTDTPEFDRWRWVDYWLPLEEIVYFKRKVYEQALRELEPVFKRAPRGKQEHSTSVG